MNTTTIYVAKCENMSNYKGYLYKLQKWYYFYSKNLMSY